MKIVKNDITAPHMNLALEEWLMQNVSDDVFMLWQNEPSVIIGRYQNAYAEFDLSYAEKNAIKIARRLSGGGAVYHDFGNLNFTFIVDDYGEDINFTRFLEPIIKTLKEHGASVEMSGRNDLLIDGMKVSGNSQCRKYGRILHHGTLLYHFDPDVMSNILKVNADKLKSKGISSVRSRVTSLCKYIDCKDLNELRNAIEEKVNGDEYVLTEEQLREVKALCDEKYSKWEFIYGTSKSFSKSVNQHFDGGNVTVDLDSDGGIIKEIRIYGDFFSFSDVSDAEKALVGVRLEKSEIISALKNAKFDIYKITLEEISSLILK